MKLEINSELSSLLCTVAIAVSVASVILGIGYLIHDHKTKYDAIVSQAKSCEELALLMGGSEVSNRIIACKIQIQPATVQGQK